MSKPSVTIDQASILSTLNAFAERQNRHLPISCINGDAILELLTIYEASDKVIGAMDLSCWVKWLLQVSRADLMQQFKNDHTDFDIDRVEDGFFNAELLLEALANINDAITAFKRITRTIAH